MGWYAVFNREMIVLWKRIGRMGYVFSSIMFPFIYLFSFGLGLGGRLSVDGGYVPFLASGIVGVTIMSNAFQQTSSSVSVGRLHFKNFQSFVLSPVSPFEVVLGIILAGVVRGMLFGALVFIIAWVSFDVHSLSGIAILGSLLGACCFAGMGMLAGMLVKMPDDVSLINNFFITPMIFFSGSFFPMQNLPAWLTVLAQLSPLGILNTLLRTVYWDAAAGIALTTLLLLTSCFFMGNMWLYRRYSE